MEGYGRTVTRTTHQWVMQVPVNVKDLEFATAWARKKAAELYGEGAGDYDNAGHLVILDEHTVAVCVEE